MNECIYPAARADEDEIDASSGASDRALKGIKTIHNVVCHPHNVLLPHKQLHGTLNRAEQSRVTIPHRLHGRALKDQMSLIMNSMQVALLAQPLVPWGPRRMDRGLLHVACHDHKVPVKSPEPSSASARMPQQYCHHDSVVFQPR